MLFKEKCGALDELMAPPLPLNKNLNSMDFKKKKNSSKQGVKFTYIAPTKVYL